MSPERRRRDGHACTPARVAARVVSVAISGLRPESLVVCDPAAGAGVFLLAAARRLATAGAPLPEAVRAARDAGPIPERLATRARLRWACRAVAPVFDTTAVRVVALVFADRPPPPRLRVARAVGPALTPAPAATVDADRLASRTWSFLFADASGVVAGHGPLAAWLGRLLVPKVLLATRTRGAEALLDWWFDRLPRHSLAGPTKRGGRRSRWEASPSAASGPPKPRNS